MRAGTERGSRRGTSGALRNARLLAGAAALALAVTVGIPAVAQADQYPSWGDVQNAISSEKAAEQLAAQAQTLLDQLNSRVASAQAAADAAGTAYAKAQQASDAQDVTTQQLVAAAKDADAAAATAKQNAGTVIRQLAEATTGDSTAQLLATPQQADQLLYSWGALAKLSDAQASTYEDAVRLQGEARAATDQATAAKAELDKRRDAAQTALAAAAAAQQAAQQAVADQQAHADELQTQIVALKQRQAATLAGYQQGVAARAAAAAAAAAAAKKPSAPASISPSGWAVPVAGRVTSGFGPRASVCWQGECTGGYHYGVDISAAYGTPVYAAHAGTVSYAGYSGELGYYIVIDHGSGIQTGYGHLSSILVSVGDSVSAGQNIARSGSSGLSTGPHFYFRVMYNGTPIDPEPFMAARGAPLG